MESASDCVADVAVQSRGERGDHLRVAGDTCRAGVLGLSHAGLGDQGSLVKSH